jgi:hypothetical protein
MPDNPLKNFRHFEGITEAWELIKTGIIVANGKTYKLELWHSHSNPDLPYYVPIFIMQDGIWKKWAEAPLSEGLEPEIALSTAMAFLSENAAA